MRQIATTIRMDKDLKSQFDSLCKELGMSINTAFNIFAKAAVRRKGIPFNVELESENPYVTAQNAFAELRRQASNIPELSLDEINAEIKESRETQV